MSKKYKVCIVAVVLVSMIIYLVYIFMPMQLKNKIRGEVSFFNNPVMTIKMKKIPGGKEESYVITDTEEVNILIKRIMSQRVMLGSKKDMSEPLEYTNVWYYMDIEEADESQSMTILRMYNRYIIISTDESVYSYKFYPYDIDLKFLDDFVKENKND